MNLNHRMNSNNDNENKDEKKDEKKDENNKERMNNCRKKLFLFDIDGTLVESSKKISSDHGLLLNKLKEKYEIGIVGGGMLNKNLDQFGDHIYFHHYLTECGCVYYKNISDDGLYLENIYIKDIRKHKFYEQINQLIKVCLYYLSQVSYILTGHFIDLRNGLVYVSLIGMNANDQERSDFMKLDKERNIRQELLFKCTEKMKELKIQEQIKVCEGGHVGIAIYPKEYDKVQVIDLFKGKFEEIHYFGDKFEENGNDYYLLHHPKVIGHKINQVDETYEIIESYLNKIDN